MQTLDLLQHYNDLSLLTLAASMLSILGLRIVTGSTSQQVKQIREFRTSLKRASWYCMRARSTALSLEFDASEVANLDHEQNVCSLFPTGHAGRHFVEDSERLIRTLATLTKDSGGMRVSCLRRRLNALERIEKESLRLLTALENGPNQSVAKKNLPCVTLAANLRPNPGGR